ncbi:hypothetical protein CROQUDRAFT_111679 [Cronartium quercuum f. sp. fusiforme G11]|uniref:Uncharacterized protein n=1 Tax=Cronartium quercuum f. sp. fusiforme G11 TaxID=708437 RepID=A0A9P6N8H4_9BASI|nr:hypothetical protein CROQUDRAFT_111679 [Cronartium quercuum f. sp. fusiforme G11]
MVPSFSFLIVPEYVILLSVSFYVPFYLVLIIISSRLYIRRLLTNLVFTFLSRSSLFL